MSSLQAALKDAGVVVTPRTPSFNEIAMAPKPRIDKIVARLILKEVNTAKLDSIRWWIHNHVPPEVLAQWAKAGVLPLDLGDNKYRVAGVGSATEYVVSRFVEKQTPGITRLVELVNKNNNNAYLKNMHLSVAARIIPMYEVADENEYHLAIVENATQVVMAFLDVEDGKATRTDEGLQEALPDLWEQLGSSAGHPLTLGNYMLNLWRLEENPESIRGYLNFWLANWEAVQQERDAGKEAWKALTPKEGFHTKAGRGIVLQTDDRFLVMAARKEEVYDIRVIVSPTSGLVSIASNKADLSGVAKRLQELEPNRWYVPTGAGFEAQVVLNGSSQYRGVTPTDLPVLKLVGLIQQYVVPHKKR